MKHYPNESKLDHELHEMAESKQYEAKEHKNGIESQENHKIKSGAKWA